VGQRRHGDGRGLYLFLWTKKRTSFNRNRIFVYHRIISAVNRVDFVSDMVSYIVLRGRWCNVHALSEEKSDDRKDK
jgi:hypothetical protein